MSTLPPPPYTVEQATNAFAEVVSAPTTDLGQRVIAYCSGIDAKGKAEFIARACNAAMKEDYKVVPVEPTQEMLYAGAFAPDRGPGTLCASVYRAMLAAAPKPKP